MTASHGVAVGERITIASAVSSRAATKLTELSRAERNRLARGRPLRRRPPERVQEVIDRAAGLPRGVSAAIVYTITTVDENRFTLSGAVER